MNRSTDFGIRQLDMSRLCAKDSLTIITAKRGAGKSWLVRDILYHMHKSNFPRVVVFSATEGANGFFSDIIPKVFIHSPLDINVLNKIVADQKDLITRQKLGQVPADQDVRLLIVLDDCAFDKKVLNSAVLRLCALNGRHYKLSLVITLQYLVDLPTAIRSNVDFAFILKENVKSNRERVYKNLAGFFQSYNVFEAVLEYATDNYGAFVIDNTVHSTKAEDIVSCYKAEERNFKFGCPALWRYHDDVYLSEEAEYLLNQEKQAQQEHEAGVVKVIGNSVVTVTRKY